MGAGQETHLWFVLGTPAEDRNKQLHHQFSSLGRSSAGCAGHWHHLWRSSITSLPSAGRALFQQGPQRPCGSAGGDISALSIPAFKQTIGRPISVETTGETSAGMASATERWQVTKKKNFETLHGLIH